VDCHYKYEASGAMTASEHYAACRVQAGQKKTETDRINTTEVISENLLIT